MWKVRTNNIYARRRKVTFVLPIFTKLGRTSDEFTGAFTKLRKSTFGFVMSVRLSGCPSVRLSAPLTEWNISAPTVRILIKFDNRVFFESISRSFKFNSNLTILNTHFTWRRTVCTFTISRCLFLRIRNFSDKNCRGSQSSHFIFGNFFP